MANTTADKLAHLQSIKNGLKKSINGSGNIVGDVFADYPGAVDDFRSKVATAITEKGVATAATDTPDQMAANIGAIESGKKMYIYDPDRNVYEITFRFSGSGRALEMDIPEGHTWSDVDTFFLAFADYSQWTMFSIKKSGDGLYVSTMQRPGFNFNSTPAGSSISVRVIDSNFPYEMPSARYVAVLVMK